MIVPQYWAEARVRERVARRPVTVRRFGWSDASVADAQRHADQRAAEAMARIRAGESVSRRERKLVYGGAEGLPIREEIVGRVGAAVLTRNGYGAVCLNTPDVLFADLDFEPPETGMLTAGCAAVALAGVVAGATAHWQAAAALAGVEVLLLVAGNVVTRWRRSGGRLERTARQRVERFAAAHPDWHLRVYRTPAGFRVLAMHRPFDPTEPAVAECFDALGTDPVYARMCRLQRCFRARVSPKPWRIGVTGHIKPLRAAWPAAPASLPGRAEWVARYEAAARDFAACRFEFAIGDGPTHPTCEAVRRLHDERCRAESGLPLG